MKKKLLGAFLITTYICMANNVCKRNLLAGKQDDIRQGLIDIEQDAMEGATLGLNPAAPVFHPRAYVVPGEIVGAHNIMQIIEGMRLLKKHENVFGEKFCTNNKNIRAIFNNEELSYLSIIDVHLDQIFHQGIIINGIDYDVKVTCRSGQKLIEFFKQ